MTVSFAIEPPVCPECRGRVVAVDAVAIVTMQVRPAERLGTFESTGYHNFDQEALVVQDETDAHCSRGHQWRARVTSGSESRSAAYSH
jgi:hypothetical protein